MDFLIYFELPQGGACISPLITEAAMSAEGVARPLNDSREVATIYLSSMQGALWFLITLVFVTKKGCSLQKKKIVCDATKIFVS